MATTTINLTNGTFVYQGYPTQAYGQGESFYRVGTASQSTWRARSLINVPLGAIPSRAIINSAKLRLYAGNSSVSPSASSFTITFYARRITSSWTNAATWNNQPSATTTGQGSVTGSGWNNTLYELDVKTIVQAWANGTTNHGLMLIQDNASLSTTKVFPKSSAVLVVDYTEPVATITQFSNFSSEASSLDFTVQNLSGGTLTAALKIGSATIFTGVSVAAASGTKSIALSTAYKNAIYDALGDSVSGTATLTLSTTIGGATSTHSATATVSIPVSVVPTLTTAVSGASAEGMNNVTAKSYAIQNVGLVTGAATATAPRGTTIKSYKWTLTGGSTKTTKDTSWVPTTSGTLAVVCTVTDGRGRTATISKNIAVTAYTPPALKMTRVDRVTVDLNKVDAIYTSTVDAISDTNRWRLVIRTRPVGGDWSTAYDSGVTTNGTSGSKTSRLTPTYAITTAYELEATLTDGYTTRKGSLMIPTESVPLAIGKYGIGVGKVPQGDRVLDVQGDAYIDGFPIHKRITDLIPFPASSSWYRVLEVSGRSFYLELLLYRVYYSTAPEIHRLGIGATYTGGGITKIDSHGTKIITNARLLYDTNANRCYVDLKYNNTSYGNAARLFYDYYSFEDPSPSSLILPGAANAVAESTSGYTVFSQVAL